MFIKIGEIIYKRLKISLIFDQKMKRSNFFNFFQRKSNIYTKEWLLDDFSFLLRYITYVWLNFIKIEFWVIFGPEITKIQKKLAKMAFILLDRAKNIWNISIKWKNALCSIKSGFSRGVAKRNSPLVLKHQKLRWYWKG